MHAAQLPRFTLLKVTVTTVGEFAELRIEGCLASRAASELWAECRRQTKKGKLLRLDLSGVTMIDERSVEELKELMRRGAEVVNASLLAWALLTDDA